MQSLLKSYILPYFKRAEQDTVTIKSKQKQNLAAKSSIRDIWNALSIFWYPLAWLFTPFQFCYPQHTHNFSARLKLTPIHTHCCLWCLSRVPCIFNILRFPMQQKLHFPQCACYGAKQQLVSKTPSDLASPWQLKLNFQCSLLASLIDKPQLSSRTPS